MIELVVICVDCGDEFAEADGWIDRCAACFAVLEDHDAGEHMSFVLGCVGCEAGDIRPDGELRAA